MPGRKPKKIASFWQLLAVTVLVGALAVSFTVYLTHTDVIRDFYGEAVADAMVADPSEICDLVTVNDEETRLIWNSDHDKILLTVFAYEEAEPGTKEYRCFSAKEATTFYQNNRYRFSDWNERFTKLLGLPMAEEPLVFTVIWADPSEIIRPAYVTDVTAPVTEQSLTETLPEEYDARFKEAILTTYFGENRIPWTRLGYTYDWEDTPDDYGLSEFVLLPDAENTVVIGSIDASAYVKYLGRLRNNPNYYTAEFLVVPEDDTPSKR